MILGRVIGEIYSTIHHPFYAGRKKLIVQKIAPDGQPLADYLIAVDHSVDAGIGQRVLVIDEGNSARQVVESNNAPIRSIIIGIVDEITHSS